MKKVLRLKRFKQFLKNNSTNAEQMLWRYLRNRQLGGFKFRRQQILCNYIVDFICFEKRLIVELDGGQHNEQIFYDNKRTQHLQAEGFQVMRFWNNEVLQQIEAVLEAIKECLEREILDYPSPAQATLGRPLPQGER